MVPFSTTVTAVLLSACWAPIKSRRFVRIRERYGHVHIRIGARRVGCPHPQNVYSRHSQPHQYHVDVNRTIAPPLASAVKVVELFVLIVGTVRPPRSSASLQP